MTSSSLRIASMNCRGLGDSSKRRDVFHYLRELNFSFYLLQDTHFTDRIEQQVKSEWGYDAYFSSFRSNSRGVAVLINNNIEYKLLKCMNDRNGNFIILHVKIFDKEFLIVNIYGPNEDNPDFYTYIEDCIRTFDVTENVIIAGDFNLVLDFENDCCNYIRRNNVLASEKVEDLIGKLESC